MKSTAKKPPMGWNSWDCYGASVNEAEVRANAEYMAKNLLKYGWEYIVVDIQWFEPMAKSNEYNAGAELVMDEYSRLMPATNRFPSALGENGENIGFKPLGDYIHSLGLKFGIHILRGIPKQAVRDNTKIKNTPYTARDIANTESVCSWNTDMYGVDFQKDGAQQYYDSIISMYADWGVDFIKVDDIARPYHRREVELIRKAIDKTGRDIVLSLSPGAAPVSEAEHLAEHANMWRMSDDFWDNWAQLYEMFSFCESWYPYVKEGCWPDADMLPLGKIGIRSAGGGRMTNFSRDEQMTMMSLWCIFRSPLMFGGDMTYNDEWTLSLITNEELLHILNHSHAGRQVYRKDSHIVWAANDDNGRDYYLAQFNTDNTPQTITTPLSFLGIERAVRVYDIWNKKDLGEIKGEVSSKVAGHGVALYRLGEC
ncbi:MAG: glycoside hydrolase family 27 protein [Clostridia bacterium]|nr:glycoside hydrolase family 27 protein [Clostridia bacterium]